MLRLILVIKRRAGMSLEEFQDYWRNVHGPLAAKYSTVMGVCRYVQVHTLDDPINQVLRESRGAMEPYDGVSELWWDNAEAIAQIMTPEGQAATLDLYEDDKNFVDSSRSSAWIATDVPQINPMPENIVANPRSPIVKLFYVFRRLPSMSREEAQFYWRVNHGPIIRSHAQAARILRYIQVHALDDALSDPIRQMRGKMEEPYDGHAELWYDRADLLAAAETPEGKYCGELFHEDEKNFVDFSRSALWIGKEHVFIDRHMR